MDLQELSQWMKDRNLKGHWEHSEWSQTVKPFLWKGDEIMQALNWSGELITTGEAGRRTIQMRNPGLAAGMTNTVHISVQLVKPGEVAAAHRHTAAAIRFIVKGTPNAYTIVEGERFPMFEGDFITTPNWTWHDHFNGSNEPVMWLDGLDVRLVTHFGAIFASWVTKQAGAPLGPHGDGIASSAGMLSFSMRRRLAASSIRSIALSGRKRSWM